ncbi:hypothetical protein SEUCBS139899_004066 [Sporothrix eucalyptigena]|uniref:NAD-dependent epimerase/dehydratase domain-containing protein n=1 Tax=Sporothrix eucalyptigena TaxID=1812306 RepID=A0ABP0BFM6_9PEZI
MSSHFVLITGTTGFIGAETLYQSLEKGYRARVTVRKEAQVAPLKARYPDAGDRLEVVVVPKLDDKPALTAALAGGIDTILHIASPMPEEGLDLQTGYIDPAVKSTVTVLEAATAVSSVKRVVITSSALSLAPLDFYYQPGYVIKEGSNPSIVVDLNAPLPPPPATEAVKYHISKILAHRATLDWVAAATKRGDTIPEVVTVHPFYVIGHDRTQNTPGEANGVNKIYLGSLLGPQPYVSSALVDVRDVAAVHVGAITATNLQPHGSVTEVITKGPLVTWEEIIDFVKEKYPKFPIKLASGGPFEKPYEADTSRALHGFGLKEFHAPLDSVAALLSQNYA